MLVWNRSGNYNSSCESLNTLDFLDLGFEMRREDNGSKFQNGADISDVKTFEYSRISRFDGFEKNEESLAGPRDNSGDMFREIEHRVDEDTEIATGGFGFGNGEFVEEIVGFGV